MKTILLLVASLHLVLGASIPDIVCPNSCVCQANNSDGLEVSCSSYDFIKKLLQKQSTTIVRLNMQNSSLIIVDPKLKYLKNLNFLDLSNNSISNLPVQFPYLPKLMSLNISINHLKEINFVNLPKNLEVIDISWNSITKFPKDWSSLKQLKVVNIHDNPIDCDCSNLLIYEQMILSGIDISKDLTCHYPKSFYGKPVSSVNCSAMQDSLLDTMLGDEGDEGSGYSEPFNSYEDNYPVIDEDSFMTADEVSTHATETADEGSGEGSGDDLIPILPIPACHINCSTPNPVGANDPNNASDPPPFKERVDILLADLNVFGNNGKEEDETKIKDIEPTTEPSVTQDAGKEEPIIIKNSDKSLVETFPTNTTVLGEMERASLENSNSQTAYIVVGLILAFLIFITIYYINKKKNNRRGNMRKRNKTNENGFGEEMKPLGKSAEKPLTTKPYPEKPHTYGTKPTVAESTPLVNGQNGKINEVDNKSPTPAAENNAAEQEPEVELRKPTQEELLTPPVQRVTIKAGEIPDSIPKTPLLVHRGRDSDGNVITESV